MDRRVRIRAETEGSADAENLIDRTYDVIIRRETCVILFGEVHGNECAVEIESRKSVCSLPVALTGHDPMLRLPQIIWLFHVRRCLLAVTEYRHHAIRIDCGRDRFMEGKTLVQ